MSLTITAYPVPDELLGRGYERRLRSDPKMSEIISSSEMTVRDPVVVSHAPVSGNLYECGPLFVDEFSILLCASG